MDHQHHGSTDRVKITLYDQDGQPQSAGVMRIHGSGKCTSEQWITGGEHVIRFPAALVRRIADDWLFDGADRKYTGQDEQTGTVFQCEPVYVHEVGTS